MTTVYSEQSLYNLYVKAFLRAGFDSRLKVHLARHILGYKQEALGYILSLFKLASRVLIYGYLGLTVVKQAS